MIIAILFYCTCVYLSFGMAYAHFRHDCHNNDEWREDAGAALMLALLSPLATFVLFLATGFARHGLLYPWSIKSGTGS